MVKIGEPLLQTLTGQTVVTTKRSKLTSLQMVMYSFPRGTTQAMALCLQMVVRVSLYVEAFGMSPVDVASAITVVKSLDILIGFIIGYATDNCRSRYGRRKPFIALGFPLWVIVMTALYNPPESLRSPPSSQGIVLVEKYCSLMPSVDGTSPNCEYLTNCTATFIANGQLPAPTRVINLVQDPFVTAISPFRRLVSFVPIGVHSELNTWQQTNDQFLSTGRPAVGLSIYFAVFYFGFFSVITMLLMWLQVLHMFLIGCQELPICCLLCLYA
jgi:hypothetical protein